MAAAAPFVISPVLSTIAVGYRNQKLIADQVLPRLPVGSQSFKYLVYNSNEAFTVPNTRVGRRGKPTNVEFGATEITASTDDYGLDDSIPHSDIEIAAAQRALGVSAMDPEALAAMRITDLIMLDREIRVANLVQNTASYDATRQITLSGTSQFSDKTNSDPIGVIAAGLDATIVRPNIAVMGRAAWTTTRQHPKLVNAITGGTLQNGLITRQQFCDLFELDELIVGEGFVNTAKRGQAASLTRVWGKHISLLYRDQQAFSTPTDGRISYGFTAQWGTRISGTVPDPDVGLRGGHKVRVGEAVKEIIAAQSTGYYIQNVAP